MVSGAAAIAGQMLTSVGTDWDETLPEYIEDANAKKPSGWNDDEPLRVPDPDGTELAPALLSVTG